MRALFSSNRSCRCPVPQAIDPILSTEDRVVLGKTANTNLAVGSETPVGAFPPNQMGFCDTWGNAWEW